MSEFREKSNENKKRHTERLKELSILSEKILDLIGEMKEINSSECSLVLSGVVASILHDAPSSEAKEQWMKSFQQDCFESELKLLPLKPSEVNSNPKS